METVNKDVKTLLAKLLATEDIHVVHKNMPTAYFDTKRRELGLPILKDMTGDIYDLMTLHEVGHALWTDNDEWMKIVNSDNDDDLPKSFINITEDVRIERKIKDKYPGGRKAFATGYVKLYKDNFFGTAGSDLDAGNLADKINLHSKVGDFCGIEFSDEEMGIYDLCKSAVTFGDAIKAAKALYKYCKDNSPEDDFENMIDSHGYMGYDDNDVEFEMSGEESMEMDSSDSSSMSDEKSEESNKEVSEETNKTSDSGKKSDEDNSDAENEASSDSDSTSDEKSTETDIASEPEKMSREGGFGMGKVTNSMQASTVIEWEDRKRDLNNDDAADYWYASIPESKMSTIIGYKKVMEHCKNAFTTNSDYMEAAYKYLNVFEKESMKSVNYMLKEFEMKKSADAYTRSSIAKTGVLDMVKMHSYKYNEDLFRKITITPGEKNHGLVMLIDWSGSMSGQIHNAFKQLMQLVWFCRRAGVKFEVFAFSDSAHGIVEEYWDWEHRYDYEKSNTFKFKLGDMAMSEHKLINLFSDRMSKMETKKMAHYLTIMTIAMGSHSYRTTEHPFQEYYTGTENIWWDTPRIPEGMNLGGTPLNSAVVNLTTFIPKYRKSNNIQKLNIVVITDGCSNNDCGRLEVDAKGTSWHTTHIPYRGNNVVFITDPVTKKDFRVNRSGRDTAALTATYLQVLKDRTGCNVVGFYLAQTNKSGSVHKHDLRYMFPNSDIHEIRAELRKNKVAICDTMGYDEYYFLPGGSALDISDEKLSVDRSMTKGKMVKAFSKHMKGKVVNRVLLNKLIDKVA